MDSTPATTVRLILCGLMMLATGTLDAETGIAPVTLYRFGGLIDGTGEAVDGHEIVVTGDTITATGDGLSAQYPGARFVDLGGLHAIPGLIDTHVHITYGLDGPSRGDAWKQLLEETPPEKRLTASIDNARRTLETGVTTVRDLLALDGVDFELRSLIDSGTVPGPRLLLSGVGIHPMTLPPGITTAGERLEGFTAAANRIVASGAEWIKIFATTGSANDLSGVQTYFYPEIRAAVDIAHAAGLRVAMHSYSPAAVGDGLRAGVDSIEHPVGLDEAILKTWRSTDTIYVPTIDHNRYYADHRTEYGYDAETEAKLRAFVQQNVETLGRAHTAGITIAMGSDAVMTMFGQNTRELEWFVEAGMSAAEALKAATLNGAHLLGKADRIGRLQPNYLADLVAVCGNPLVDIKAVTRRVAFVMKAGEVFMFDQVKASCHADTSNKH
jgi:imidazolonepropionase-like amidohydrolase